MGAVFANAHCTIASPVDANGGLFHSRKFSLRDFPCHLRFTKNKALTVRAKPLGCNPESFAEEVDDRTLSWQSWGFQERLLSRRILHFGPKFVFFECNTHIASEATTPGQPFAEKQWIWGRIRRKAPHLQNNAFQTTFNPVNGHRNFFNELRANRSTVLSSDEELRLHDAWFNFVSSFTRCSVISPSDRSLAILGLAQVIQDGKIELEYMHGLWKRHFLFDLLWFVKSLPGKKQRDNRTRSWSWQTVNGIISQRLISCEKGNSRKERKLMKVAELVIDDSASATSMQDRITLKCPLLPCAGVFSTEHQQFVLQLQTEEGRVEASFAPDILDFDEQNLIGAEIIQEVILEDSQTHMGKRKYAEIAAIWSNGIVLQRNYCEDGSVTHERVGRFWIHWPLVRDEGDSRDVNIVRRILRRSKRHVVRVE